MSRVETIGDCTLYLGDCLEVLPTLGPVDAVVTDPPYGCGKSEWDSEYPRWLVPAAFRIAPRVVIMPGLWALPLCVTDMGAKYRGVIAGRNMNGMTHGPLGFNNWIPAVCGGDVPIRGQDAFDFTVDGEKPDHPSPKPLAYMCKLIERVTDAGENVADLMMGSGTTGVACVNLGRRFVGIEIEPRYFDAACKRIEAAWANRPRLFEEKQEYEQGRLE